LIKESDHRKLNWSGERTFLRNKLPKMLIIIDILAL